MQLLCKLYVSCYQYGQSFVVPGHFDERCVELVSGLSESKKKECEKKLNRC